MNTKPAERALSLGYIRRQIGAAARLARGDASAMRDLDQTADGFFRSFFAAALVLPIYVFQRKLMAETALAGGAGVPFLPAPELAFKFVLIESLSYALQWTVFPLVMAGLTRFLRIDKRYVPFVVAFNWSSVVASAVSLAPYMLYIAGIASPGITDLLSAATGCFIIYYFCLVAVLALEVKDRKSVV